MLACQDFWAEAVTIACFLINRSPFTLIGCKTLDEICYDKLIDYSNIKIVGYLPYIHVRDGKLDPREKKVYVFLSRDVTFDKFVMSYLRRQVDEKGDQCMRD